MAILATVLLTGCVEGQRRPARAAPRVHRGARRHSRADDRRRLPPRPARARGRSLGRSSGLKGRAPARARRGGRAAPRRARGGHALRGLATWYGRAFQGRRTASGEIFNMHRLTAAHRTLPFGTLVKVTNLRNGRTVVVRITDRGPFGRGRILDLSRAGAARLGILRAGVAPVQLRVIRWGRHCRHFHGRTTCSAPRLRGASARSRPGKRQGARVRRPARSRPARSRPPRSHRSGRPVLRPVSPLLRPLGSSRSRRDPP